MATLSQGEQLLTSRAQRREEARMQRKQEKRDRNARLRDAALASGAALALGAGLLSQPVEAATFTVLNNFDGGEGSLREAISDANGAAGADVITFDAGVTGSIVLTSGQLSISDSVDIQGPGAATLTVDGNNASRVFYLYSAPANIAVSISGLTITGGAASRGAGIRNFDEDLTLDGVVVSGNTATSDGGGLHLDGLNMNVIIRNSTISGNSSDDDGGGVYVEDTGGPLLIQNTTISGNSASNDGGGVYFYDPDSDVTIETSTISGNSAGGDGGGVYLYDTDGGTFTIRNSTITNNTAGNDGGDGGGVFFEDPDDPVVIKQTTISGNTAGGSGGGIAVDSGPITVLQSIVADNEASSDEDVSGGTFEVSFSLIEDPGSATITDNGDNIFSQDPQLGPLQDNGGPTETRAIPDTSPAFDAAGASCLATDQRGVSRPQFTDCDMGAFELEPAPSTDPCDIATPTLGCIVNGVLNQPCVGGPDKDVIVGTSGDDVIFGGGGNDELRGNQGDDLLCGEEGNDILVGATGNDILVGGAGKDVLRGEVGNDVLDGGSENDRLLGGPGDDNLTGGDGTDTLRGDAGTDTCDGEQEIACEL